MKVHPISPEVGSPSPKTMFLKLLEFRVCLATLCQPPRSDRTVRIGWRLQKKATAWHSCRGGTRRWPDATNRPGFAALCGDEAERLEIAEPVGERVLDETRRQRRRLAPATDPDQGEGLWLRPRGQQHQQGAADQHQVQPTQQGRSAALPHRTHAVAELE